MNQGIISVLEWLKVECVELALPLHPLYVFMAEKQLTCTLDLQYKSKGKVVPMLFLTEHHTMKVYWGVEI